jgi:putative peptidoglycan lipid II flippase
MTSQFKSLTTSAHLAAVRLKSTHKQIFRALLSLSSAALLARMAGMLNQIVVTSHFGASATMDAYFVAYTLPTVLAYLFIDAIEDAVIPVYTRVRAQGNNEAASRIFSTVLNLFLLGTVTLTVLLIIFRRETILLTAPALDPFRAGLAADLAPFMYPVLFLMVVVALLECIFNVEGQFGWPAYAGLLVPLATAALVIIAGQSQGVVVLCTGMVLGLCLQLGVFIIRARRAKLVYRPILDLHMPEIGAIFIALWPALLGGLIGQASPLIDQIFASVLSAGSISALAYALKIISIFSGVIFVSVGRAVLPYLSRQAASNDIKAFKNTLRLYLWAIGLGTAILSLLMLLLAHPIVQLLFQRGAFSAKDTEQTATTFIGFVFGLTPMSLGFILARAFSALGKTRIFIWTSAFSLIASAVLDFFFAQLWQSQGIALATSTVYLCTMFILLIALRHQIGNLELLTPPTEFLTLVDKIRLPLTKLSARLGTNFTLAVIALVVFAAGLVGNLLNSTYTLRLALGSILIVFLLRYSYVLVITWVIVSVVMTDSIPIFTNNNILTALTVPTLLFMTYLPIRALLKRMPILWFLLVYLGWIFAGIGISALGTVPFLTTWLLYLDYLMVSILVIHTLTTQRRLYLLIDFLILGGVFVSVYGIYGYITHQNGAIDPTTSLFRIHSVFDSAPGLALFLSVVTPVAVYRATTLRGWKQAGSLLSILLLLTTTLLSFSRGAFVCIPLSIVILVLLLPSGKTRNTLIACMAGLTIGILMITWIAGIPILARFLDHDVGTLNGRTVLWQALFDRFDPKELLGHGLMASNGVLANLPIGEDIANAPSNLFLATLYDHGIIGLGLLLAMLAAILIGIIKGIFRTKGEQRILFSTALAILISVLLQLIEQDDLWSQEIGIYFWIIMALPFSRCWDSVAKAPDEDGNADDGTTDLQIEVPWWMRKHNSMPTGGNRPQSLRSE